MDEYVAPHAWSPPNFPLSENSETPDSQLLGKTEPSVAECFGEITREPHKMIGRKLRDAEVILLGKLPLC